ncbi:MAG: flagellar protein FlaG [Proteobacteria bacterium]|nr:flagellar protein FlaG [Pseudomonadota bacterium]
MDVNNIAGESKSFGSMPVAPAIVRQDKQKVAVTPVASSTGAEGSALDKKALSREGKLSQEQAVKYVQEVQARFDKMGTNLQFSIDNSSEDVVVRITDKKSGELIRQFPSEEILQLRNKLNDLVGMLFDGKA